MPSSKRTNISDCKAISDAFLSLHESDGFERLSPSSLLHSSVPMSFVMSAGIVHIENELEQIVEKFGGKFAFTQPCFRYFDMKHVGEDSTHSSLFHMPAAFHIDSCKRENMLPRLWFFLTSILGLKKERLWITYLDDQQFGRDQKTYDCWLEIGVQKNHLIELDQNSNFWRQKKTGQIASDGKKCGPHTEVFYERTEISCSSCENKPENINSCNCGRFVEISNTLFIENYITSNSQLEKSKTIFSECVIGSERIAMILQNVRSVHETMRFYAWRNILQEFLPSKQTPELNRSVDIILDHLSAFSTLVKNGAPEPGRGGQSRIMKNLARGILTQMVLHDLDTERLISSLLADDISQKSCKLLKHESIRFIKTLEKGKFRLIKLLKPENVLTTKTINTMQSKYGVPPCLSKKFFSVL